MKTINKRVFSREDNRRMKYQVKSDLTKYHRQRADELEKDGMPDNTPLSEMSNTDILFEHFFDSQRMYQEMGYILENIYYKHPEKLESEIAESFYGMLFKESPIKFEVYQNKYIIIETPIVFKNAERHSNQRDQYCLANNIMSAKREWENKNNASLSRMIEGKYTMVFLRRISRDDYENFADSDNIELKKVSNMISRALSVSDAPTVKSEWTYSYRVAYKEDVGLTMVIMREEDGPEFLINFLKYKNIKWLKD